MVKPQPTDKTMEQIFTQWISNSEDIVLEATRLSPFVKYHTFDGSLTIIGDSLSANAAEFYEPFIERLKKTLSKDGYVKLIFHFHSFGPKTAKVLFDLFADLRTEKQKGNVATIIWRHDPDDTNMAELGTSFAELFGLDFEVVC